MNNAGLSSICHGTNGLKGSAFRAIRSTLDAGLALAPGVGDEPVPVGVCVHALSRSAPITTPMTGHPILRANMKLSLRENLIEKISS
jgi:hypothetical protein